MDFNKGLAIITDNTRLVLEAMIDRGIAGLYLATHLIQILTTRQSLVQPRLRSI